MIAPYPPPHAAFDKLRQSRRTAAMLVLGEKPQDPPRVAGWRAWLAAGWMVLVLVCYGLHLLGGAAMLTHLFR